MLLLPTGVLGVTRILETSGCSPTQCRKTYPGFNTQGPSWVVRMWGRHGCSLLIGFWPSQRHIFAPGCFWGNSNPVGWTFHLGFPWTPLKARPFLKVFEKGKGCLTTVKFSVHGTEAIQLTCGLLHNFKFYFWVGSSSWDKMVTQVFQCLSYSIMKRASQYLTANENIWCALRCDEINVLNNVLVCNFVI